MWCADDVWELNSVPMYFLFFVCMVVCWLVCLPAGLVVCWLVCAGWVCGTRTYLNAVWCFGCIEMDWLACDCVQLFGFLFLTPSGWGNCLFFLCSNFLDASTGFCGLWWFVCLLGFGLFTACFGCCSEIFLWRVWSWLRTNAGGVLNTCKSNDDGGACTAWLVANGWVTREQPALHFGITSGNRG